MESDPIDCVTIDCVRMGSVNMSTQTKFFIVFIIGLVVQLLIGSQILGQKLALKTALPFFGWTIIWLYFCWQIKCPKCQTPFVQQNRMLGLAYVSDLFKGRCSFCDADLTKQ